MAAVQQQSSDEHIQLKRRFADFLERDYPTNEDPSWNYGKALASLYVHPDDGKDAQLVARRLMIAEHHLREFDSSLLQRLLTSPAQCLPAFEEALRDFIKSGRDGTLSKLLTDDDTIHIGLKGDFGKHEVSPRDLDSTCLGKLVCVFGIVTKCSLVRPKVRELPTASPAHTLGSPTSAARAPFARLCEHEQRRLFGSPLASARTSRPQTAQQTAARPQPHLQRGQHSRGAQSDSPLNRCMYGCACACVRRWSRAPTTARPPRRLQWSSTGT